jgi:cell division protein ZapA (FtsZ GTPase activity inhibitor)
MFCKRSEEGLFRKAATNMNEKIAQYSSAYPGAKLESEDLLAMVALHFSAYKLKLEQKRDTNPLFEKIEALDKVLEEYLKVNS